MSVTMKKSGMAIRWHKAFSILAPWRKGKDADSVLDSAVVLTKMKLFSNVTERLLTGDDSSSGSSAASEQNLSPPSEESLVDTHLDDQSGQHPTESSEKYLSEILSGSRLSRLYKFQSEDSGVELSSGANSPSTPTGSEENFVVHSRESSFDSSNSNPEPRTHSDKQARRGLSSAVPQPEVTRLSVQVGDMLTPSNQLGSSALKTELHVGEVLEVDQCGVSQSNLEHTDKIEDLKPGKQAFADTYNDEADAKMESSKESSTRDSLDKYMDECCRLSQVQQSGSNPLGSGLGYLEHICQLIERIGHLQKTNFQLQKQMCRLQKEGGVTKTKEDFFRHHCCCGAATLAFEDLSEASSPGGTIFDLSTIPEATRHRLLSTRRDMSGLASDRFRHDGAEGRSVVYRQLSDGPALGRVKDLVKRTKLRPRSKPGLSSTSLKMSCPQLYRPDLGREELAGRNRNSMIVLGHHSKSGIPWLQ